MREFFFLLESLSEPYAHAYVPLKSLVSVKTKTRSLADLWYDIE